MPLVTIAIIAIALLYAFLNGVIDSSSIVATMISSRASSMRAALGLTAVAEFLGPLLIGTAVATTITRVVADYHSINLTVILVAILTAVLWNLLTSSLGIPSSSSHALIGGLVGAVATSAGIRAIYLPALWKILLSLFISPLVGFIIGYTILRVAVAWTWDISPNISNLFKRLQVLTVIALGLSHGSNDAPKTMGIITLALLTSHSLETFTVPSWVIIASALAIAAGTAIGGQRLIRTVGGKFYRVRPLDAFCSQLASASVIVTGSLLGGPMSATQVLSSSILGVGSAERPNKVRWGIGQEILTAWLLTIPATALVSAILFYLINPLIH